jgi:predicted Zn finger-like uncharacterized protein
VKFLCDRCKTRYSIGDDRVRGKILKIRCKNCANVITVREGAPDPDAPAEEAPRARRPSTGAPPTGNALRGAFAKQMTKPPPALEEEWYVSIDGQQSGPFSLGEAQRWVGSKPLEADLHCWSEGFDDWLPVDKVSHFRNLRKPRITQATTPPPIPRAAPVMPRSGSGRIPSLAAAPAPAVAEAEPKPLFAATMAALERDSGAVEVPARANGSGTLAALAAVAPAPAAVPRNPMQAKANVTGPMPKLPTSVPTIGKVAPRGGMSSGAKALAEAFDVDEGDSATSVGAPAFPDMPEPEPAAPLPPKKIEGEDDMEIGEVSRVVNLADLAKSAGPRKPRNTGRSTGLVARLPANELGIGAPGFGQTGPFQPITMPLPGADGPVPSESVVAAAPAREHRRGMMILLGASALLLAGGVVALVLLLGNDDSETSTTLSHSVQYDNDRPDDVQLPRPRNAIEAVQQQAQLNAPRPIKRPVQQQITKQVTDPVETPGDLTKTKIKPEEIEDIANKNSEGTKRCYIRAQKGALGIDIADLKRIDVLFSVDGAGNVTSVSLSDHTNDQFGQCLIGRIKSWKFRTSPGGQFKLPMVFGS